MVGFNFGFGLIWGASIGFGWFIAALCIAKKYDPEKKVCTVSDLIKLTFSSLTLWLCGAIFFSISVQPKQYASLVDRLVPLSDKTPNGYYYLPNDPDRRLEYERVVEEWASSAWFSDLNLAVSYDIEPTFVIVGTPDTPMAVICNLKFSPNFTARRIVGHTEGLIVSKTPVRYQAHCSEGESG